MIERTHLTMADMLRTIVFTGEDQFEEFDASLQAVAWAIRTTISTATNYSPGQLIFNHDMIMQTAVTVNWELIKQRRRELAVVANNRENKSRIEHSYSVDDQVLIILDKKEQGPKLSSPTEGPYKILKLYTNGTVKIQRGSYQEILSVRRLKPYKVLKNKKT